MPFFQKNSIVEIQNQTYLLDYTSNRYYKLCGWANITIKKLQIEKIEYIRDFNYFTNGINKQIAKLEEEIINIDNAINIAWDIYKLKQDPYYNSYHTDIIFLQKYRNDILSEINKRNLIKKYKKKERDEKKQELINHKKEIETK